MLEETRAIIIYYNNIKPTKLFDALIVLRLHFKLYLLNF